MPPTSRAMKDLARRITLGFFDGNVVRFITREGRSPRNLERGRPRAVKVIKPTEFRVTTCASQFKPRYATNDVKWRGARTKKLSREQATITAPTSLTSHECEVAMKPFL